MIKTYNITPRVYYNESRDFQFIGRLYDSIFNHTKSAIDLIDNVPFSKNSDYRLFELILRTIGFNPKHSYDIETIRALINSFKLIIKDKGTKKSIENCVKLLLKSQNLSSDSEVFFHNYVVEIHLPSSLIDVVLLEDMLDYILPTGYLCEIYVGDIQSVGNTSTIMGIDDNVSVAYKGTGETSKVGGVPTETEDVDAGIMPMTMIVGETEKSEKAENNVNKNSTKNSE